jgi:hypothetical protein
MACLKVVVLEHLSRDPLPVALGKRPGRDHTHCAELIEEAGVCWILESELAILGNVAHAAVEV